MKYLDENWIEEMEKDGAEEDSQGYFDDKDLESACPSSIGFQILLGLPIYE